MATLFGLLSSMVVHALPPVDRLFLAAITVFFVYTAMVLRLRSQGYTSSSCVLFPSRRQAPKPACGGGSV